MKEERSLVFHRRWGPSSSKPCTEGSGLLGSLPPLSSPDGCFRLRPFPAWHFRTAQFEFEARGDLGMRKGGLPRESQARARAGRRGSWARPCPRTGERRGARRPPSNRWPLLKIKPRRVVIATTTTAAVRGWQKLLQGRRASMGKLGAPPA